MKKVLSLVLALTMVLGSFSFVAAADYSDVADTDVEAAVARLSLLEILEGYPDGTFKPANTITRAEFAAVAVRARGLNDAANAAKGLATGFTDVTPAHWASGYVGTAGKLGIVNGVGAGLFAPEAPVKYEEAVTMVVRALGYEASAQTKGGYPYGYLIVANDIGLLDDVKGTQGSPAPRGLVAQLVDNALEIPKMIQVGFGSDAKWVVSGSAEHGDDAQAQYLLHDLGIDEIKGHVTNNFRTKSTVKADEIEINNTKYDITEDVDVDAVLGVGVTAWAKDDVVFSITVGYTIKQSGKDIVFTEDQVIYDAIVESKTDEDEAFLYDLDDEYDWANRARIFVNNEDVDAEDIPDDAYGRFVLNEDDEIEFAYLFSIEDNDTGIVTAIDDKDLEYVNLAAADDVLALDDAEEIYVFNKNLAQASLDEIEEDTAVFYWIDEDDNYFIIADNNPLEGNLDAVRVRDSRITVAGTNVSMKESIFSADDGEEFITIAGGADFDDIEDYVDENVVLYYNLKGDALALVTDADVASSTVYGVATWFADGRTPELSVYNGDGEEVDYEFEERDNSVAVATYKQFAAGDVTGVKFKLNKDGEIKEDTFEFVTESAGTIDFVKKSDDKFGTDGVGGSKLYITKDTVVIRALNSSGKLKPSIIKYDDIINKEINATNNDAIAIFDKGNDLALLVFVEQGFQGTDDTEYGIVTSDPVRRGDDYRIGIDVAGITDEPDYYVMAKLDQAKLLKSGDLIVFTLDTNGEVVLDEARMIDLSAIVSAKTGYDVVETKNGNYITVSGDTYRRTTDTIFYQVNNKGDLNGTGSYGRIDENSTILKLVDPDNDELMVVLDLTPWTGKTDAPAADPKNAVVFNGVSTTTLDGNYYIYLGDEAYPYVGPEIADGTYEVGTEKVIPTFTTVRNEKIVTGVEKLPAK